MGFGVWGLGFGAWGLGLGVWGLGSGDEGLLGGSVNCARCCVRLFSWPSPGLQGGGVRVFGRLLLNDFAGFSAVVISRLGHLMMRELLRHRYMALDTSTHKS